MADRVDLATATQVATAAAAAASAATAASTAASTAATAATTAAAAQADVDALDTSVSTALAAKVPTTGSKTIAGATDFTTLPTVSTVPVATTDDLDGYVPTAQAATFVNALDVDGTGDVTISSGGKDFVFNYLTNVLQGGFVEDGVDPAVEELIVLRYGPPVPTATAADLWPATKPSSGGPIMQWAASPAGTESTYEADAFGTGVHGWRISTDAHNIALPGSAWSPEPGAGRALIAMSLVDVMVTTGAANTPIIRFLSGITQRFGLYLSNVSGTLNWVADGPTPAEQTQGTYDSNPAITDKIVYAVVLQGASSKVLIASEAGVQELAVDLAGVLSFSSLDLMPFIDGTHQGAYTVHEIIAGPEGFSDAQVLSAMGDLAANVGFTIGA